MLVVLQRAQATFILKHVIIASKGFLKLSTLSSFPSFSLFICFLWLVGALEHDCSNVFLRTLGLFLGLDLGLLSLFLIFPLLIVFLNGFYHAFTSIKPIQSQYHLKFQVSTKLELGKTGIASNDINQISFLILMLTLGTCLYNKLTLIVTLQ